MVATRCVCVCVCICAQRTLRTDCMWCGVYRIAAVHKCVFVHSKVWNSSSKIWDRRSVYGVRPDIDSRLLCASAGALTSGANERRISRCAHQFTRSRKRETCKTETTPHTKAQRASLLPLLRVYAMVDFQLSIPLHLYLQHSRSHDTHASMPTSDDTHPSAPSQFSRHCSITAIAGSTL